MAASPRSSDSLDRRRHCRRTGGRVRGHLLMWFGCRAVTRPIRSGFDFVGQPAAAANDVSSHRWHTNICPQSVNQIGRFERHEPGASIADAQHVEALLGEAGQRLGVLVHAPSVPWRLLGRGESVRADWRFRVSRTREGTIESAGHDAAGHPPRPRACTFIPPLFPRPISCGLHVAMSACR